LILELDKFNALERKIKNILKDYSLLKKQNQELKELLKNTELELEGAKGRLAELNGERDAVRTKLDTLINLLQDVDINV
jgi:chromosome segregation ATPase